MHDLTRGEIITVYHDGDSFVAQMSEGIDLVDHETMRTLRRHDKREMEEVLRSYYPNHSIMHRVPTRKNMLELVSDH